MYFWKAGCQSGLLRNRLQSRLCKWTEQPLFSIAHSRPISAGSKYKKTMDIIILPFSSKVPTSYPTRKRTLVSRGIYKYNRKPCFNCCFSVPFFCLLAYLRVRFLFTDISIRARLKVSDGFCLLLLSWKRSWRWWWWWSCACVNKTGDNGRGRRRTSLRLCFIWRGCRWRTWSGWYIAMVELEFL